MEKQFRVLRFLALLYQILAWVVLVVGIVAAVGVVVVGATIGRVPVSLFPGMPSVPFGGGLVSGIILGLAILIGALLSFVLHYAAGELIHLALAIEHNTRETAYYLRGEAAIPPPPAAR